MFKKKQWTDLMLGVGGVKKIDGILVLTFFFISTFIVSPSIIYFVLICIFPITGEVDHNAILWLLASLCSVNFHSCVLPICFYFDYFPFSYNLWEISSPFYGMYSFHL